MSKAILMGATGLLLFFSSCTSTEHWRKTGTDVTFMEELDKLAFTSFADKHGDETTELTALRWEITRGIQQVFAEKGHDIAMVAENTLFDNFLKSVGEENSREPNKFRLWAIGDGIKAQAATIVNKYGEGDDGFEIELTVTISELDEGTTKAILSFRVFSDSKAETTDIVSRYISEALLGAWVKIDPSNCELRPNDVEVEAGTGPPRGA